MYCEVCGKVCCMFLSKKCKFCRTKMKLLPEDMKYKYHIFVEDWFKCSDEEIIQRKENFVMGELQANPLFSMEEYNNQVNKQIQINKQIAEYEMRKLLERQSKNIVRMQKVSDKQNCIPRCPICTSSNIKKVAMTTRAVKTAAFGVAGAVDDAGKTYQCNNCGCKF